jgi:hypothetical protein
MADERDLRVRLHERDSSLRRLKTLTGVLAVAMTALTGIFAELAAQTAAGRKLIRITVQARATVTTARQRPTAVPPPPPLPAAGSDSAPALAAPAQPPAVAPASATPVVVSGGS